MRAPRKNKQWAEEAHQALVAARALAAAEKGDSLEAEELQHLYKYAPLFCLRNRGIRDKSQLRRVAHFAFSRRLSEIQQDPDRIHRYGYHFLAAYLDAHVALEQLSEKRAQEVLRFLLENYAIE
ncbi:MAG: hypothetical protein Kow006_28360 [Gammaproteobacteria bacterium]